jgi:hypothetical protein
MPHLAGDGPRRVDEYYVGECTGENLVCAKRGKMYMTLVCSLGSASEARDHACLLASKNPGNRYYVLKMSFGALASVTLDTKEY